MTPPIFIPSMMSFSVESNFVLVLQFPQLQCETNVVGRPLPNKVLGCISHGNIQSDYLNVYFNLI